MSFTVVSNSLRFSAPDSKLVSRRFLRNTPEEALSGLEETVGQTCPEPRRTELIAQMTKLRKEMKKEKKATSGGGEPPKPEEDTAYTQWCKDGHCGVKWECPACPDLFPTEEATRRHCEVQHPKRKVGDLKPSERWKSDVRVWDCAEDGVAFLRKFAQTYEEVKL